MAERPADAALRGELARIEAELSARRCCRASVSELCPEADGRIAALGAALGRGVALVVDYGVGRGEYYHPARGAGTLRCHYRHRAHADPFLHPGLQDITALVDFTRLAEAALWPGSKSRATATQAAFPARERHEADVQVSGRRAHAHAPRARRASCCCRARWARPSRRWR
ncbi:MAG: SAM-dependent methyltransferase [Steroidobacteraceae bacterium]